MEKILIVANWKMNPVSLAEAKRLFNLVKKACPGLNKGVEVVICPPGVYLPILKANGAQDCFWEEKGAYTGEVSPRQLKNLGVKYVILGHSERRKYQKETDDIINKKIKAVLKEGLKPILCIENLSQLKNSLRGVTEEIIIAYEPTFAIGTGKACSIEKAKKIRNIIKKNVVLYGGSVNSQNAKGYIEEARFQGLLIGGASLSSKEFVKIVDSVNKI